MLVTQSTAYNGKQLVEGFVGYVTENNFFAIISIEDGITQKDGEELSSKFKAELHQANITNLSQFESIITQLIVKLNFPAHFSLAIGLLYNDALYVKTVGKGQVYFRRGKEFDLLMEGDKSASGYVQEYDMAIFTTSKIKELIGAVDDIKAFVDLEPPNEITVKMQNEGYDEDAKGFIGLFVEFLSEEAVAVMPKPADVTVQSPILSSVAPVLTTEIVEDDEEIPHSSTVEPVLPGAPIAPPTSIATVISPENPEAEVVESLIPQTPPTDSIAEGQTISTVPPQIITSDISNKRKFSIPFFSSLQFRHSKKISMVIVAILFGILLWSVVFGYQRRMAAELQKKVETTKEKIQANLAKAEDEAFLDFDKSIELIDESKADLESLKQEVGESKPEDINEISKLIEEAESKIVKRDEKESTEFYDLGLEAEDAQGEAIYVDGENVAILDKKNSTVYVLSLDKKSFDKYTSTDVTTASHVSLYDGKVFFINSKGVYEFTTETKSKQVIAADDWGNIIDMEIYNGNIYLLDQESDEIYKYLVAEGGYSDKNSYFGAGNSINLADSVDMTIDSAVYIAQKDGVMKYVAGAPKEFVTKYPERTPNLSGVYTNTDIEQVFVWDKKAGIIYELSKEGEYKRQVTSSIIRKANGVFVYDDKAFVFDGKKLYTIALD